MFYPIITAADPQHSAAAETLTGLRGYLRYLPGAQEKGIIYGTGAWDKNDIYWHPAFEKAYEEGKRMQVYRGHEVYHINQNTETDTN